MGLVWHCSSGPLSKNKLGVDGKLIDSYSLVEKLTIYIWHSSERKPRSRSMENSWKINASASDHGLGKINLTLLRRFSIFRLNSPKVRRFQAKFAWIQENSGETSWIQANSPECRRKSPEMTVFFQAISGEHKKNSGEFRRKCFLLNSGEIFFAWF